MIREKTGVSFAITANVNWTEKVSNSVIAKAYMLDVRKAFGSQPALTPKQYEEMTDEESEARIAAYEAWLLASGSSVTRDTPYRKEAPAVNSTIISFGSYSDSTAVKGYQFSTWIGITAIRDGQYVTYVDKVYIYSAFTDINGVYYPEISYYDWLNYNVGQAEARALALINSYELTKDPTFTGTLFKKIPILYAYVECSITRRESNGTTETLYAALVISMEIEDECRAKYSFKDKKGKPYGINMFYIEANQLQGTESIIGTYPLVGELFVTYEGYGIPSESVANGKIVHILYT